MSCSSASSPINISKAGTGDCRLKCNYSFNYSPTSLQATNRGDFIRVSMDKSPQPPVVYNTERYNVQEMRIYHPSLHTYGGKHAAGEILIMHNAVSGGSNMIVSIPIVDNGGSSSMMDELITQVARSANTKGGKMNINLPVFLSRILYLRRHTTTTLGRFHTILAMVVMSTLYLIFLIR